MLQNDIAVNDHQPHPTARSTSGIVPFFPPFFATSAACGTRESIRPSNRPKIGSARHFAEEHPLELKQRLRLVNSHDDNITKETSEELAKTDDG